MARHKPKHLRPPEKKFKRLRAFCAANRARILAGVLVVYLVVMAGITVYSQMQHRAGLPTVTLLRHTQGVFDASHTEAVYKLENGLDLVYVVESKPGPWGTQYFLKAMQGRASASPDGRTIAFSGLSSLNLPLAAMISAEDPYSGMEVMVMGVIGEG